MGVWVPFGLPWIDLLTLEGLVMGYLDLARGRYSCREFEARAVEQAVVDSLFAALPMMPGCARMIR